jgi:solute carrier family 6 (neurotransmitter transporter, GABA) member 1
MGLPIVLIIILIGRGASLPNAWDGIRLYIGTWHGGKLSGGQIWTSALGQVFFSTGVGFGYFTAYASYQTKHSNAVQDAVIICMSNSAYEVFAAFAVFGVVGFLGMHPNDTDPLGSFSVAFLTYPEALAQMPVTGLWSFFFFLTLFFLGMSSAFALIDALNTMIMDLPIGKRIGRPLVVTGVCIVSFLLSLIFCSRFGYYLLDGVDTWVNDTALIFVVMVECIASTTVYRYKEVASQVGWLGWGVYQLGYFGGTIIGVILGHTVSEPVGAGVGFGIYIVCTLIFLFVAKTPDCNASSFWNSNHFASKFWWVAFYSVSPPAFSLCPM